MQADSALPELASVPWRQRTDARWLRRWARIWHAWTLLYTVPFICAGVGMIWLEPLATPVGLAALAHAWIIPELYAFRGASVVRPKEPRAAAGERVAQGLLGDLLPHDERELQRETGLARQLAHVRGLARSVGHGPDVAETLLIAEFAHRRLEGGVVLDGPLGKRRVPRPIHANESCHGS